LKEVDRFQKTYQKNLRPLFTKLGFSSENSKNTWFLSITELQNTFNTKDHNIDNNQIKNIPKSLEKYLLKDDGQNKSIDLNRYEYWLYRQIQEKVSSGVLYIEDSKLNKCFNHELVSLEEKDKVLKGLDIPWLRESAEKQVQDLLIVLDGLWKNINQKYEQGELKHLRYDEKKQKFIWLLVASFKCRKSYKSQLDRQIMIS
jgi:hypothetical protein